MAAGHWRWRRFQTALILLSAGAVWGGAWACGGEEEHGGELAAVMEARQLSEADILAAAATYTPTGRHDDYYIFASGGHSGQVLVIGVPSMRIIKYIAVFTPDPWQGYGYGDESDALIATGSAEGGPSLSWGDTHHPALSETAGDYDGDFLFIGDKANARIAVINLTDFVTTQIVHSPLMHSSHGAAFVTPNTDYIIETSQYASPLDGQYHDLTEYNDVYRGVAMFWRFDRAQGRIVPEESWAVELPPYTQDLADAGKLASDGFAFFNSFNTERAWGGNMEGNPSMEEGASQNDMDYLHVFNWRAAEAVVAAGQFELIQGVRVIRLQTAIDEGLLVFVPEPKSPHGVDVTPNGEDLVVGGKLDAHVTVYSFAQIRQLMESQTYEARDPYGVPILPFDRAIRGQVDIGLGPLHTVFDNQGYAYTSLFLEPAVARWSLETLQRVDMINVHYNVGHLVAAEGDTVSPDGHYLVALNKWALDRFSPVGPLVPQNLQLIDISGETMRLLYDLPIPLGEPHYAQMIAADKIEALEVYTPRGYDPLTRQVEPNAPTAEDQARIEVNGNEVDVYMTAIRSHFRPDIIRVRQGQNVRIHITNLEQAHDATHGFSIALYNIQLSLEPGETANVDFVASIPGVYPIYCTEFCSALHLEMAGYLMVEPAEPTATAPAETAPVATPPVAPAVALPPGIAPPPPPPPAPESTPATP